MTQETIRPATAADIPAIRAIYAPYVLETAISFETEVPGEDVIASRIEAAHLWLVAEREGRVVAYAYAGEHRTRAAYRFSCDCSVYVDRDERRGGLGSALYTRLLPEMKARGFHNAYGGLNLPNDASVALHERFGFRHIGTFSEVGWKLGRWHDVGWWEKRL